MFEGVSLAFIGSKRCLVFKGETGFWKRGATKMPAILILITMVGHLLIHYEGAIKNTGKEPKSIKFIKGKSCF